jgi:hypothetical protein
MGFVDDLVAAVGFEKGINRENEPVLSMRPID